MMSLILLMTCQSVDINEVVNSYATIKNSAVLNIFFDNN